MGSVRVLRARDIPAQSTGVSTEGWARTALDVGNGITIIEARNPPGGRSRWHEHGENLACVYVRSGVVRLQWGAGGRESAELSAGDFYIISPHTVHREENPGSKEQLLIALAVGPPPKFIEGDGPTPDEGSARGVGRIRVVRAGELSAEPATAGVAREVASLDDAVTVGGTRMAPGTSSAWHHHGEGTTCVYLVQGLSHVEWGSGGGESADLAAGDFYFIDPNTIHRESNPGSEDQVLAAFLLGGGFTAVNVDGPESG